MLNDCIYLLRVEEGDTSHYIYIKRIESLLNLHHHLQDKDNRFCPMCNGSIKLNEYEKHVSLCYTVRLDTTSDRTILEIPKKGSVMEFTNLKNKMVRPYIVYADFECTLIPEGNKNKFARHVANSACFYFVCSYDSSKNRLWYSVGENCVQEMLIELNTLAEECIKKMQENQKIDMTKEDKAAYYNVTTCHICNKKFNDDKNYKVRDHDHRTGEFRGAAHTKCNINYFCNRYLPIVFHNLRGYDGHQIIQEAYNLFPNSDISVIPNSYEKFMSFKFGPLKFIDSFQFMASSLESLVENL
jgi:hypothetical protein